MSRPLAVSCPPTVSRPRGRSQQRKGDLCRVAALIRWITARRSPGADRRSPIGASMVFHVKHSVAPAPALLFHIRVGLDPRSSRATSAESRRADRSRKGRPLSAGTAREWVRLQRTSIDSPAWFDESKLPGAPRGCGAASAQHAEIDRGTSGLCIGLATTITCSSRSVRDLDAHCVVRRQCCSLHRSRPRSRCWSSPPRLRSSLRRRWFRDQFCHQLLQSSIVFRAWPTVRRLVNLRHDPGSVDELICTRSQSSSSGCRPAVMGLRASASLFDSAPRGLVAGTRSADGEHLHLTTGVGSEDARCPFMRSPLDSPRATHPRGPVDLRPASGPPQDGVWTSRALRFDFIDPRCLRSGGR